MSQINTIGLRKRDLSVTELEKKKKRPIKSFVLFHRNRNTGNCLKEKQMLDLPVYHLI